MQARRMRSLLALSLMTVALTARATGATEAQRTGLVVESAGAGYEAARAGLRAGDVLLSWERRPNPPANPQAASGILANPFEVRLLEWEQAPRGPVRLLGRRGSKPVVFELSDGDIWHLEVRPRLEPEVLARLEEGRARLAAGELEQAQSHWDALAATLEAGGDLRVVAWLERQRATALADNARLQAAGRAMDAATTLARAAGADVAVCLLLRDRALMHQANSRLDETREAYEAARGCFREVRGRAIVGPLVDTVLINDLGLTASRKGDAPTAARLFSESLAIRRRLAPGSGALSSSLINLATESEHDEAEGLLVQAHAILERLSPGSRRMPMVVNNLAKVAYERGYLRDCIVYLEEALKLARAKGDDGSVGLLLANLSEVSQLRGDLAAAEAFSQEAADLIGKAGHRHPASRFAVDNLLAIGSLARIRGDLTKAQATLERALTVEEAQAAESPRLPSILVELAAIALERGERAAAEELASRASSQAIIDSPSSETLDLLGDLAEVERQLGNEVARRRHLERAFALVPEGLPRSPAQADLVTRYGELQLEAGDLDRARELFESARRTQQARLPGTLALAASLRGLALADWRSGRHEAAADAFHRAVTSVETQRRRMRGDYEARARFNARTAELYRDYIEFALDTDNPALAFELSERARARAYLDVLGARHLSFSEIDPELDAELEAANLAYDRALSRAWRQDEGGSGAERATADLIAARERQNRARTRLRALHPRPGALGEPRILGLEEVRAALAPGTMLLSYVVGEETTFLFVVGPGDAVLGAHRLAVSRLELERRVRRFRAALAPGSPEEFAWPWARRLGAVLLGPAGTRLLAAERLLVLPDGPLHDLPFAALADPGAEARYLVERLPVSMALSVSSLAAARRNVGSRQAAGAVAFAAPIFSGPRSGAAAPPLADLPASRAEAETVGRLFPGARLFLGVEASEANAKSIARDTALVHIATHGAPNRRFPLESALVFSTGSREHGNRDNGLLQAWEIFEQVRIDAELVTLSACSTAAGEELAGEGLIGLTRAFQFAGARSVLASLWPVADDSTAALMEGFYRRVRAGVPLDRALQQAQVERLEANRAGPRGSPFHWAGFQLYGDAARSVAWEAPRSRGSL